jgi:hypothetical protein
MPITVNTTFLLHNPPALHALIETGEFERLDDKLQKVAQQQKSYFKSSFNLKIELVALQELPPNAGLFSADAIVMYTNIPAAGPCSA